MPMQAQPEGTSRVRLDAPVENPDTGKPFPARAFGIDFADPDYGKVRIGETHRVQEGKRRGDWEPCSVVPDSALPGVPTLLEPVERHNDAMEYLRDVWNKARENGWAPSGAQKLAQAATPRAPAKVPSAPSVPAAALPETQDGMSVPAGPEEAAPSPVALDGLPEMPGVPVVPVPPGTDAGQFVLPAARTDVATSKETGEVIRELPAGHPDDPSTNGQGPTPPGEPIVLDMLAPPVEGPHSFSPIPARLPGPVPQADPEVQQAVVDADDWLNQPARPSESFPDGDFPLDFPGPVH